MKLLQKISIIVIIAASNLFSHSLWINSMESFTHQPGHTMVSLGWGHSLPLDDILNSANARVIIEDFSIISPNNVKTKLQLPKSKIEEPFKSTKNFDLYEAQIALQKISLKKDSKKGVYSLEAKSKPTFYTQYIDTKNRTRLSLKSRDKVKNIKKVLMSVKYQAFAKSYLTLGSWSEQKPLGHGLEIIPISDLSNVKVGDLLEFRVLFNNIPLNITANSIDFITAFSNSFGQSNKFSLHSNIVKGKAQFIVQSSGSWIVNCSHKEDVRKDGKLKDLYGKANQVFNSASLTFNVK